MAKYKVLRETLIGNRVYAPGDEVEFDGIPADNLEPLDAAAKKAATDAEAHFAAERSRRQLADNPMAAALGAAVVQQMKGGEAPKPPAAPIYKEDEEVTAQGRSKS
jgi:hypothetical protein